ncbi:MAG: metalloregulator ArsR/SmtB family transcription factor [Actinomycetota bacterium]
MDGALDPDDAEQYARWFHCLADPTRLRVLNTVARAERPMTVGEITALAGRSQSTVSKHLQVLADERFVLTEPDGIRTLVRVNRACMEALPRASAEIMAVAGPAPPPGGDPIAPAPSDRSNDSAEETTP